MKIAGLSPEFILLEILPPEASVFRHRDRRPPDATRRPVPHPVALPTARHINPRRGRRPHWCDTDVMPMSRQCRKSREKKR